MRGAPTHTQNVPKTSPKRPQNPPKIDQKSTSKRPRIGISYHHRLLTLSWLQKAAPGTPKRSPEWTLDPSKIDKKTTSKRAWKTNAHFNRFGSLSGLKIDRFSILFWIHVGVNIRQSETSKNCTPPMRKLHFWRSRPSKNDKKMIKNRCWTRPSKTIAKKKDSGPILTLQIAPKGRLKRLQKRSEIDSVEWHENLWNKEREAR